MLVSGGFTAAGVAGETGVVTLGSGFHYLEGDYGETPHTYMSYVPVVLKYRRGRVELKGTVSYLRINGPNLVVGDSLTELAPLSGTSLRRSSEGLGDSSLLLRWQALQDSRYGRYLDISLKHKFATADEDKGLGTGASSDTLRLEYLHMLGGHFILLEAGYRWRRDSEVRVDVVSGNSVESQTFQLKPENGIVAAAGWGYQMINKQSIGVIWNYRQAASKHSANDNEELMLFYQLRLDRHWKLSPYVGAGLNNNSSDFSAGLQWSYRY